MHRITNPNLEILEAAVELLDELADRLVFLGGCATGLLLTDIAAPPIRATHGGCHHRSGNHGSRAICRRMGRVNPEFRASSHA